MKQKRHDPFLGLRLALTGNEVSPPLSSVIAILGKTETLRRIDAFQAKVTKMRMAELANRRLIPL